MKNGLNIFRFNQRLNRTYTNILDGLKFKPQFIESGDKTAITNTQHDMLRRTHVFFEMNQSKV